MRAKTVNENMDFQRGKSAKAVLKIGNPEATFIKYLFKASELISDSYPGIVIEKISPIKLRIYQSFNYPGSPITNGSLTSYYNDLWNKSKTNLMDDYAKIKKEHSDFFIDVAVGIEQIYNRCLYVNINSYEIRESIK